MANTLERKKIESTTPAVRVRKAAVRSKNPSNRHYETLSQMSDEDLMSQFQAGTVEAFDILVSRYKDPLTNYIYRFLGDMKECEDLLQ